MILLIAVCAVLLNILWLVALMTWPDFPLHLIIAATIVLSSFVSILSLWLVVA